MNIPFLFFFAGQCLMSSTRLPANSLLTTSLSPQSGKRAPAWDSGALLHTAGPRH